MRPLARVHWRIMLLKALEGRLACLLANHGQIALGATPSKALAMAHEVETLASQYVAALQIGQQTILDTR